VGVFDSVCTNVVEPYRVIRSVVCPSYFGITYAAHCNCCWFIM